jgi:hypothetical protein
VFKRVKHGYSLLVLGLFLVPVLLFQNCGSDYQPSSLYADNGTGGQFSQDCISAVVDCGPRSEFLLVSIDTQDPLILSTANTFTVISGRCNTGNYPEHHITYEVRNAVGTRVLYQEMTGLCLVGRYQFNLPLNALANNASHTLYVSIVGIDDNDRAFTSTQSGGSAQIDFFKQ